MQIAVITGGATAERAVAFAGAAQIVEALRSRGHTGRVVDPVTGLLSPTDESRLLTTAVGREPPAVAELDERERAMLSNGLARLTEVTGADVLFLCLHAGRGEGGILQAVLDVIAVPYTDRKSTRLNSSHGYISYAVFCLKKKNNIAQVNHPKAERTA